MVLGLARFGGGDQVHPVPRRDRLHERDRGDHLLVAGQGLSRPADGGRPAAVPREVGRVRARASRRRRPRRSASPPGRSRSSLLAEGLAHDPGADRRDPRRVGRRRLRSAFRSRPSAPGSARSAPRSRRRAFPRSRWNACGSSSPPALTVALLAAIESLLSAVVADGMIGSRHKSNVELVGQGDRQRRLRTLRRDPGDRRDRPNGDQRQERRPDPDRRHDARGRRGPRSCSSFSANGPASSRWRRWPRFSSSSRTT